MQYNISFFIIIGLVILLGLSPFSKKKKSYSARVLLPTIIRFNSITCPLRFELGYLINGLMRRLKRRGKLALRRREVHKEELDHVHIQSS